MSNRILLYLKKIINKSKLVLSTSHLSSQSTFELGKQHGCCYENILIESTLLPELHMGPHHINCVMYVVSISLCYVCLYVCFVCLLINTTSEQLLNIMKRLLLYNDITAVCTHRITPNIDCQILFIIEDDK